MPSYRDEALALNPLFYLQVEESAGTIASDASPNARHGTYRGGFFELARAGLVSGGTNCAGVAGVKGDAGAHPGAVVVDPLEYGGGTWADPSSFTHVFWLNMDSVFYPNDSVDLGSHRSLATAKGWWQILDGFTGPPNFAWSFSDGATQRDLLSAPSDGGGAGGTVRPGRTDMIAVVYDADGVGSAFLYKGNADAGALQEASRQPAFAAGAITSSKDIFFLGEVAPYQVGADSPDGRVDEWAFYGSALAKSQLDVLYSAGAQAPFPVSSVDQPSPGGTTLPLDQLQGITSIDGKFP